MRILLLFILYAGVCFFPPFVRYSLALTIILCWFIFFLHSRCLFHLLFMRSILFLVVFLPEMFILFFLRLFFMKRRSYLVFVIVFHEKFPISQAMAFAHIHSLTHKQKYRQIHRHMSISDRAIENEEKLENKKKKRGTEWVNVSYRERHLKSEEHQIPDRKQ